MTDDHKTPRCRGGGNGANMVKCCNRCNSIKSDMTEAEFNRYVDTYGYATPGDLRGQGIKYFVVKALLRVEGSALPVPMKIIGPGRTPLRYERTEENWCSISD